MDVLRSPAKFFHLPSQKPSAVMAARLYQALHESPKNPAVRCRELADLGAAEGRHALANFNEKYEKARKADASTADKREWQRAQNSFCKFYSRLQNQLQAEREKAERLHRGGHPWAGRELFILAKDDKIYPDTLIYLTRVKADKGADTEQGKSAPVAALSGSLRVYSEIRLLRGGTVPIEPVHVVAKHGERLHIVATRTGDWDTCAELKDHPADAALYLAHGRKLEPALFKEADPSGLSPTGRLDPRKQAALSPRSESGDFFNGWVWGLANARSQVKYSGTRVLYLEAARMKYRDFRVLSHARKPGRVPEIADLRDRLQERNRARHDEYLPPAALLHVAILPVLVTPDGKGNPCFVLSSRIDRAKLAGVKPGALWSPGVSGVAVSERLHDEDRGPSLEVQAQRLIRRQLAIDIPESAIVWTGFAIRHDWFAAVVHGMVTISATPKDLFGLFARRTIRHDADRLAVVSLARAEALLKGHAKSDNEIGAALFHGLENAPQHFRFNVHLRTSLALALCAMERADASY